MNWGGHRDEFGTNCGGVGDDLGTNLESVRGYFFWGGVIIIQGGLGPWGLMVVGETSLLGAVVTRLAGTKRRSQVARTAREAVEATHH